MDSPRWEKSMRFAEVRLITTPGFQARLDAGRTGGPHSRTEALELAKGIGPKALSSLAWGSPRGGAQPLFSLPHAMPAAVGPAGAG